MSHGSNFGGASRRAGLVATITILLGLAAVTFHTWLPLFEWSHAPRITLPYIVTIDDEWYKAMAESRTREVDSPFSKRFLYPFLARSVARATGLPVAKACVALNFVAWTILVCSLVATLQGAGAPGWLAVVFLLTPMPLETLLLGYMPELMHIALVSVLFWLLWKGKEGWAMAILFLAFLTRESTLLLCLVCMWVGWRRGQKKLLYGSFVALAAGMAAGAFFARLGRPNIYHLPDFVYLAFKVAYNGLRNFFGVMFWSNVAADRTTPTFIWHLPEALHWGKLREVGLRLTWEPLLITWITMATVFGFAPLAVWRWREIFRGRRQWPIAIHIALVYGTICFVLGPALGATVDRLIGAGWPLVWLALPYAATRAGVKWGRAETTLLIVCYLLLAWITNLAGFSSWTGIYAMLLMIPALYLIAARHLPRLKTEESGAVIHPANTSLRQ